MNSEKKTYDEISRRAFLASAPVAAGAMGLAGPAVAARPPPPMLYRSETGRNAVMTLYERKLHRLTLAHDTEMVPTRYGHTHVLTLGPPDAPPLLALHGVHFGGPFMADFVAPFADRYRIIIPDIVGQPGRSADAQPDPKGHNYAAWISDVLDGLKLRTVPVIGISFGGAVALDLATFAPQRISKAVLVVPGGFESSAFAALALLFRLFLPWHAYRMFPDPTRIKQAVRPLAAEMENDWYEYFDAILRHVRWLIPPPGPFTQSDLKGFSAPTAIYAARQDIFFPGDALVAAARKIIPSLEEANVYESSHFPTKAMQEEVTARVSAFLS
jgi:pimeloyl-ACP methyl ester carboxylesterase